MVTLVIMSAENIKKKGLYVPIKRLMVEEKLGEVAKSMAIKSFRGAINLEH